MDHDETGCQPHPEGPILCVNSCGFFGSPANMNMCSKCYKDLFLKQERAHLAASSIENIVNGSSSGQQSVVVIDDKKILENDFLEVETKFVPTSDASSAGEVRTNADPNKCSTCKKRVGLTGFKCRCGDLFCGSHRYSDKHNCSFDYRTAGQDAIAKANPVVKAEKLDKI